MMSVSARSDQRELSKAYREFSRRRYAEVRATSRNLRESEAIQVIIREWEALTPAQRLRYLPDQPEAPGTPTRNDLVPLKVKSERKTTSRKPEEPEMPPAETPSRKVKPIAKSEGRRNYISFFRFHFRQLTALHQHWTSAQTSAIISLKWRKEKLEAERRKTRRPFVSDKLRQLGKVPGRRLFRMAMTRRGLEGKAIVMRWKRLPTDSKRMWQRRGDPSKVEQDGAKVSVMTLSRQEGVAHLLGQK